MFFTNSKLLYHLAIPVVPSYELVTYGRHGILYDKAEGEPMLELLLRTENWPSWTTALAALHKEILACKLSGATSLKSILQQHIEYADLDNDAKSRLLAILKALPDGDGLCRSLLERNGCQPQSLVPLVDGNSRGQTVRIKPRTSRRKGICTCLSGCPGSVTGQIYLSPFIIQMGETEQRLAQLGIVLGGVPPAVANYLPAKQAGNIVEVE